MKIKSEMIMLFLAMVSLPMLAMGTLGYYNAEKVLKKELFRALKVTAENKEAEIMEYLEGKKQRAIDFASGRFISEEVERIISIKDQSERKKASKVLNDYLKTNRKPLDPDILEIHILDLEGRIIAGTDEEVIGSDKDNGQPYFLNGKSETYIQPPYVHEHHGVKHRFLPVATPIKDLGNNKVIGVLMNGYALEDVKALLSGVRSRRLGNITALDEVRTLEILLFNDNKQMLASSKDTAAEYIGREIETEPVLACLNNAEEINREWTDYKGVTIWGASACIHAARDWKWALVVKEDKEEAFAPVIRLRNISLFIGMGTLLLAVLAALRTAQEISKPIRALHKGTEIIGSGNLDYKVGTAARDEIGQLSTAFDSMTEGLKAVTASREELNREITERILAEEKLSASETQYRRLFETSQDGLLLLEKQAGHIINVNPAIVRMLGRQEEDFTGKALEDIGLHTGVTDFQEIMKGLDKTGFIHYEDVPVETGEGKRIDTEIFLIDRAKVIQCNVRDITKRKLLENAMRESEAFIRNILDSVDEGFILIDKDYKIITANKAYCAQMKASDCDILGRHCYEVSHHLDRPCFLEGEECAASHTFKTGMPSVAIHTHLDSEGKPVYTETKSFAVRDASGEVTAIIETINNITEKRRLEEQLRHAQKMEAIGTLAGGIAHDFNNMLNVIIGYGGLMQMRMKEDDPLLPQLKEILSAGDKAAQLTKGLLLFSRKQTLELKPVNINDIIEGFKKMLN